LGAALSNEDGVTVRTRFAPDRLSAYWQRPHGAVQLVVAVLWLGLEVKAHEIERQKEIERERSQRDGDPCDADSAPFRGTVAPARTRVDRWLDAAKNHPVLSVLIFAAIIVGRVASVTRSVQTVVALSTDEGTSEVTLSDRSVTTLMSISQRKDEVWVISRVFQIRSRRPGMNK
jgi:hypothetical protein